MIQYNDHTLNVDIKMKIFFFPEWTTGTLVSNQFKSFYKKSIHAGCDSEELCLILKAYGRFFFYQSVDRHIHKFLQSSGTKFIEKMTNTAKGDYRRAHVHSITFRNSFSSKIFQMIFRQHIYWEFTWNLRMFSRQLRFGFTFFTGQRKSDAFQRCKICHSAQTLLICESLVDKEKFMSTTYLHKCLRLGCRPLCNTLNFTWSPLYYYTGRL